MMSMVGIKDGRVVRLVGVGRWYEVMRCMDMNIEIWRRGYGGLEL